MLFCDKNPDLIICNLDNYGMEINASPRQSHMSGISLLAVKALHYPSLVQLS